MRSIRSQVPHKLGKVPKRDYNGIKVKGIWIVVGVVWTLLCLGMEQVIGRKEMLQLSTANAEGMSRVARQCSAEISLWAFAHLGGIVFLLFLAAITAFQTRKIQAAVASI